MDLDRFYKLIKVISRNYDHSSFYTFYEFTVSSTFDNGVFVTDLMQIYLLFTYYNCSHECVMSVCVFGLRLQLSVSPILIV